MEPRARRRRSPAFVARRRGGDRRGEDASIRHPRRCCCNLHEVSRRDVSTASRHHGFRPVARPVRGRSRRAAGGVGQGYGDAESPYTPAWQETITGVPAATAARIGREFAANAEESKGRSMIVMGAGTNHWFHSDTIYRAFLTLTNLTGCQGVNGGGWAHYVARRRFGRSPVHPDRERARLEPSTAQHDPDRVLVSAHQSVPLRPVRCGHTLRDNRQGAAGRQMTADVIAQSARMGWMPSYPTFDRNPLDLSDDAAAAGGAGGGVRRRPAQVW